MRLLSRLLIRVVNCSEIQLKLPQTKVTQISRYLSSSNRQLNNSIAAASKAWGSKKSHRKIKIQSQLIEEMSDPLIEEKLAPLRASVKEQVIFGYINYLEVTIEFN